VLAALRGSGDGHQAIFATSDNSGDDELARRAQENGLSVFRGPLHDVLGRFHQACATLAEDCLVIRLTGDNVVPDGTFTDELKRAFHSTGVEYIGVDPVLSGLPYGLSGEAFSVAALRRAHRAATNAYDREHVGPWMKRNCKSAIFRPQGLGNSDFSHLRCTLDDEEDYARIIRLFDTVKDPLRVRWQDLLEKLVALPGEPTFRVPYRVVKGRPRSEFTLGTAQLGMEYGAVNDHGQPPMAQAVAMIRHAIAHGVTAIDTARSYGTAERVLHEALGGAWASRVEVITKLDLSGLAADANRSAVRAMVDESVQVSRKALGASRLAVVLLHRWRDHHAWQGAAWQRLLELRAAGEIAVLGASVYQPDEALDALQDDAVEHLQIPLNVLDWRWQAAGVDRAAASRRDVIVHARSALLQGVLVHPARRWPAEGAGSSECASILQKFAENFGRESVADLCLAYVRSLPWVTSVVVGCETQAQLEENLRWFRSARLTAEQCGKLREELPYVPENFLNPSKWKNVHERVSAH